MEIRLEKLREYIEAEKIMEFESNIECMEWFNIYDFQNLKTIEEMKSFQGIYGFNIGKKRYHILLDEALDVYSKDVKKDLIESMGSSCY